jgi:hypothetical protein
VAVLGRLASIRPPLAAYSFQHCQVDHLPICINHNLQSILRELGSAILAHHQNAFTHNAIRRATSNSPVYHLHAIHTPLYGKHVRSSNEERRLAEHDVRGWQRFREELSQTTKTTFWEPNIFGHLLNEYNRISRNGIRDKEEARIFLTQRATQSGFCVLHHHHITVLVVHRPRKAMARTT